MLKHASTARDGDLVQLVGLRHKHFILNLQAGAKFETHRGILQHDDLIGRQWGTQVLWNSATEAGVVVPCDTWPKGPCVVVVAGRARLEVPAGLTLTR